VNYGKFGDLLAEVNGEGRDGGEVMMALSEWADWAAIISTILAAAAATFAGWEVYKSRQERKQDLRFMYAQRAVLLTDMLRNEFDKINEIDQQLAYGDTSHHHLDLLKSINISSLLHEAKICESLAKVSNVIELNKELVCFLEMFNWMQKEQEANLIANSIAGATRLDSMVWIGGYEKRQELKNLLGEKYVFKTIFDKLILSIESAYQVRS
jgi:hypothetical protein